MRVLIIIPAYNEEENILRVVKEIEEYKSDLDIDYIVINDGSSDNTLEILEKNNIEHINLFKNLGIGGAVQTGYKYANSNDYDIAIQYDGDGQHDIHYIETICEPIIQNKADLVIGTRYLDKSASDFQSTFMRRFGSRLLSNQIRMLFRKSITDPTSGFRAANKAVIANFAKNYPTEYPEPESLVNLLREGFTVLERPVNMRERLGGVSSINPLKSADYMIKVSLAMFIERLR